MIAGAGTTTIIATTTSTHSSMWRFSKVLFAGALLLGASVPTSSGQPEDGEVSSPEERVGEGGPPVLESSSSTFKAKCDAAGSSADYTEVLM